MPSTRLASILRFYIKDAGTNTAIARLPLSLRMLSLLLPMLHLRHPLTKAKKTS